MKHTKTISPPRSLKGFTLIELLTVIAIIAVLAAILIPAVGKVRKNAMTTKKASAYRQYFIANGMYAADHKGKTCLNQDDRIPGKPQWRHLLAPYLVREITKELAFKDKRSINESEIYACPFYKDLHPESGHWETGVGMNSRVRKPESNLENLFWGKSENWSNTSGETLLSAITYPERRIFIGDVAVQYTLNPNEASRADTTRHDGTGMFVRSDGSIAYLNQAEAELALTDPSKRYESGN